MNSSSVLPPKIVDLINQIAHVAYEENYIPPEGHTARRNAKNYVGYKVQIKGPESLSQEIQKLLTGKPEEIVKSPGNPSFLEQDLKLVQEMKAEMQKSGKTKDQLFDKYIGYAQARSTRTQDESIRDRLEKVFIHSNSLGISHAKGNTELSSTSLPIEQFFQDGDQHDDYHSSDLEMIRPWIEKYRDELIKILNL